MTALDQLRQLWQHVRWANAEVTRALRALPADPEPSRAPDLGSARREFAHLVGAEEVWLARLDGRPPRAAVWPDLSLDAAAALAADTIAGYEALLGRLGDARLGDDQLRAPVAYTNSAGRAFETPVGDVLLHVALHGQYHRGRVNLLLRQGGSEPAPVDYIAFVRGAPAARDVAARHPGSGR